ncbi:MAG: hypothetical protein ABIE43_00950 [Patescibacteria group bacterium]
MKQHTKNSIWIIASLLLIIFLKLERLNVKTFMVAELATGKTPAKSAFWNILEPLFASFWLSLITPLLALIVIIQLLRFGYKNYKQRKENSQMTPIIIMIINIIVVISLIYVALPKLWQALYFIGMSSSGAR